MPRKPYDPLPQLIEFASSLRFEDLPPHVVHEAKRRVIDALGCSLASLSDKRMMHLARSLCRDDKVSLLQIGGLALGTRKRLHLESAAFLNSTMIRWLDWNDTYLAQEPAHPSDNLGMPFALAETRKISGKALILAAVIAYDIQCRLCEAASLRARGWDHVNYILISATLAGARCMGMSRQEMYDAVAFALNSNAALRQAREGKTLSEQKNMAAGDAVRAAMWALRKTWLGLHGPDEIMLGKHGFIKHLSGRMQKNAFGDLGTRFLLPETYIKKWPVEYHAQTVVAQALEMRAAMPDLRLDQIERVVITTYEAAVSIIGGEAKRRPLTKETADHSIYFAFATALKEGELTLSQYCDETYQDPAILSLMDKIELRDEPRYTKQYQAPPSERSFPSHIAIYTKNGFSYASFMLHPPGHPRNPLSDSELNEKFVACSAGVSGRSWTRGEQDALEKPWHLEDVEDVRAVLPRNWY